MLDLARTDSRQHLAHRIREREEIVHSIGSRQDDDHTERQHREVVLLLQFAIHRDEHIDGAASPLQQVAILDARPAEALDSSHVVPASCGIRS